jgi:hypothetical protein
MNIKYAAENFIRNIKLTGYVSDVPDLQHMDYTAMNIVLKLSVIPRKCLRKENENVMNVGLYQNTVNRIIFAFIVALLLRISSIMGELATLVQK